jgi:hypothetical protein
MYHQGTCVICVATEVASYTRTACSQLIRGLVSSNVETEQPGIL